MGKKYWGSYKEVRNRAQKKLDEAVPREQEPAEKKSAKLQNRVERRAHALWVADGRKKGRNDYYWQRAEEQIKRESIWFSGPIFRSLHFLNNLYWRWGFREKTAWDLLELLIVPVFLAGGAFYLEERSENRQQFIARERNRQEALKAYLSEMTTLLVDKYLAVNQEELAEHEVDPRPRQVRNAAELAALGLTGAVVTELDGPRNGQVLAFLARAGLGNVLASPVLQGITLEGADLSRANLRNANLGGADLSGAFLDEADLSGTDLFWTDLSRADLSRADLSRADLSRADLTEANLFRADLTEAILFRADLTEAILFQADFSKADLSGADLSGALLSRADLSGANLFQADLSGADLFQADLSGADLSGADLSRTDLSRADLTNILYNDSTKWPEGFTPSPSQDEYQAPTNP